MIGIPMQLYYILIVCLMLLAYGHCDQTLKIISQVGVKGVLCNATASCPDGTTCCMMGNGNWGCCPDVKATCCSDKEHCCPEGYNCKSDGSCIHKLSKSTSNNNIIASLLNVAFHQEQIKSTYIICPDGYSECDNDQTCCKLNDGSWGCCPIVNAVCCSDGDHCCPAGTTCNLEAQSCDSNFGSSSLLVKLPSKSALTKQKCDAGAYCGDQDTCCRGPRGQWMCCPIQGAKCCLNGNCCPLGYKCDYFNRACSPVGLDYSKMGVFQMSMKRKRTIGQVRKRLAKRGRVCDDSITVCRNDQECQKVGQSYKCVMMHDVNIHVKANPCPDGRSECPGNATCCIQADGNYACCNAPKATCCADNEHCCPSGYNCNMEARTCDAKHSVPMVKKHVSKPNITAVICPDGSSACANGQTCCAQAAGGYGCCSLPNAVCCADHIHCCPEGYRCNVEKQTCESSSLQQHSVAPFSAHTNAVNTCPDGQSMCGSQQTCCKVKGGGYGCCNYPDAMCCSDNEHCCPSGYECNMEARTCDSKHSVPMMKKQASKPVVSNGFA